MSGSEITLYGNLAPAIFAHFPEGGQEITLNLVGDTGLLHFEDFKARLSLSEDTAHKLAHALLDKGKWITENHHSLAYDVFFLERKESKINLILMGKKGHLPFHVAAYFDTASETIHFLSIELKPYLIGLWILAKPKILQELLPISETMSDRTCALQISFHDLISKLELIKDSETDEKLLSVIRGKLKSLIDRCKEEIKHLKSECSEKTKKIDSSLHIQELQGHTQSPEYQSAFEQQIEQVRLEIKGLSSHIDKILAIKTALDNCLIHVNDILYWIEPAGKAEYIADDATHDSAKELQKKRHRITNLLIEEMSEPFKGKRKKPAQVFDVYEPFRIALANNPSLQRVMFSTTDNRLNRFAVNGSMASLDNYMKRHLSSVLPAEGAISERSRLYLREYLKHSQRKSLAVDFKFDTGVALGVVGMAMLGSGIGKVIAGVALGTAILGGPIGLALAAGLVVACLVIIGASILIRRRHEKEAEKTLKAFTNSTPPIPKIATVLVPAPFILQNSRDHTHSASI